LPTDLQSGKEAFDHERVNAILTKIEKALDGGSLEAFKRFSKEATRWTGITISVASFIRQSQIISQTLSAIFRLMGYIVDIFVTPFLPIILPFIQLMAENAPFMRTLGETIAGWVEAIVGFIARAWSNMPGVVREVLKWLGLISGGIALLASLKPVRGLANLATGGTGGAVVGRAGASVGGLGLGALGLVTGGVGAGYIDHPGISYGVSAASGAATGAILGSIIPGFGTLAGAGIGAVVGSILSLLLTGLTRTARSDVGVFSGRRDIDISVTAGRTRTDHEGTTSQLAAAVNENSHGPYATLLNGALGSGIAAPGPLDA